MKIKSRETGFSLLEVLVAFAVLALTLGVLLRIFGGGTRTAQTVADYTRAISIAESLLATAGVEAPLEEGETEGDVDADYHWHLSVRPFPVDEALLTTDASIPPQFKPYWVTLTVGWGGETDPRQFTLQTLRTLRSAPMPRVPFR